MSISHSGVGEASPTIDHTVHTSKESRIEKRKSKEIQDDLTLVSKLQGRVSKFSQEIYRSGRTEFQIVL